MTQSHCWLSSFEGVTLGDTQTVEGIDQIFLAAFYTESVGKKISPTKGKAKVLVLRYVTNCIIQRHDKRPADTICQLVFTELLLEKKGFYQVSGPIFTAHIRRMGKVTVSLCLSVHTRGTYLGWGYLSWVSDTYLGRGGYLPWLEGVPTLAGGYLPWMGRRYLAWGYLPWTRGTYLGWEGTIPWTGGGVPTLDRGAA